jgi:hypothetical protein
MDRRRIDIMISTAGLIVAVVLLALGGLLVWGNTFINDQVHDQLAAQKIFFPPPGSEAIQGPEFANVRQYAGEQLTTGPQAKVYANDFIGVHLTAVAGGRTYSEVSSASQADPGNETLKAQADTLFRGTTLQGLLLNAYAFSEMAQIAGFAALVSFIAAGVLLLLVALGFAHARKARAAADAAEPRSDRVLSDSREARAA